MGDTLFSILNTSLLPRTLGADERRAVRHSCFLRPH